MDIPFFQHQRRGIEMIFEYKNVPIMRLGVKYRAKTYYKKHMNLPVKHIPININWDENITVGYANNFRILKRQVLCDLKIVNSISIDTIAPTMMFSLSESHIAKNVMIDDLSLINGKVGGHADKSLNHNLRNKRVKIKSWREIIE